MKMVTISSSGPMLPGSSSVRPAVSQRASAGGGRRRPSVTPRASARAQAASAGAGRSERHRGGGQAETAQHQRQHPQPRACHLPRLHLPNAERQQRGQQQPDPGGRVADDVDDHGLRLPVTRWGGLGRMLAAAGPAGQRAATKCGRRSPNGPAVRRRPTAPPTARESPRCAGDSRRNPCARGAKPSAAARRCSRGRTRTRHRRRTSSSGC